MSSFPSIISGKPGTLAAYILFAGGMLGVDGDD